MILTNLLLYYVRNCFHYVKLSFSGPVVHEKKILKIFSQYKHMQKQFPLLLGHPTTRAMHEFNKLVTTESESFHVNLSVSGQVVLEKIFKTLFRYKHTHKECPLDPPGEMIFNKLKAFALHRSNGPVRIRVRIGPPHLNACRKRRLNGVVLRMRPEKPRSHVTVGVAR
jgi:hypothetical protein